MKEKVNKEDYNLFMSVVTYPERDLNEITLVDKSSNIREYTRLEKGVFKRWENSIDRPTRQVRYNEDEVDGIEFYVN